MQKNKKDFCLTECILIIVFTLVLILNFDLVADAEELPTYTPFWDNEHTTADDIINFVNTQYNYDVVTTNYLVVYGGGNAWYDYFNVYATPLPTANGEFLGSPLYVDANLNIYLGTYTEIFRVQYVHNDGETDYGSYYFTSSPPLSIDRPSRIYLNTERSIYYKGSENVAIVGQVTETPDLPDGDYTGHSVKPPFYDDENTPSIPDTETLSDNNLLKRIANGILDLGNKVKNGFNNVYDNIKDFTQPYYEEFLKLYNAMREGIDYIRQPVDLDAVKTKISNLSIIQDVDIINTNVDNLKNLFNGASPKTDSNAQFVIDFTPVEMFNTGQVVVDFSFYSSIRTICNAFILMSVLISFILYILKALPDIIRGASADDK